MCDFLHTKFSIARTSRAMLGHALSLRIHVHAMSCGSACRDCDVVSPLLPADVLGQVESADTTWVRVSLRVLICNVAALLLLNAFSTAFLSALTIQAAREQIEQTWSRISRHC